MAAWACARPRGCHQQRIVSRGTGQTLSLLRGQFLIETLKRVGQCSDLLLQLLELLEARPVPPVRFGGPTQIVGQPHAEPIVGSHGLTHLLKLRVACKRGSLGEGSNRSAATSSRSAASGAAVGDGARSARLIQGPQTFVCPSTRRAQLHRIESTACPTGRRSMSNNSALNLRQAAGRNRQVTSGDRHRQVPPVDRGLARRPPTLAAGAVRFCRIASRWFRGRGLSGKAVFGGCGTQRNGCLLRCSRRYLVAAGGRWRHGGCPLLLCQRPQYRAPASRLAESFPATVEPGRIRGFCLPVITGGLRPPASSS